jgi:hypothetical protein
MGLASALPALTAAAQPSDAAPTQHAAALKMKDAGYQHAVQLIAQGKIALDQRGDWRLHRPTAAREGAFIDQHGAAEFGTWFLAVNEAFGPQTLRRWAYPFGDFEVIRRSALIAAQSRAREWGHAEVQAAAERLLAMIAAKTPG